MSSDHFSTQAAAYAQFRPSYPREWFDWLSGQVAERTLAWDCACGSGQATVSLAGYFDQVVGTDLSSSQLSHAPSLPNIEWRKATAEESGLEDSSVDLITVAQALHWFDLPRFWAECRRVLKPDGIVAVWSYGIFRVGSGPITAICDDYYSHQLKDYWPPERRIVEAGYGTLDFPFTEIDAPEFHLRESWSLDELTGYLASWSATERFRIATGTNPIPELRESLAPWFTGERIEVCWPLSIRVGRKS